MLTLDTDTVTLSGNYGITGRLDVSAAVPFVRLELDGQRIDTQGGSGVAVGSEFRLPTGNADNLLGAAPAPASAAGVSVIDGMTARS